MKNETLVRAISEIDDDLIEAAYERPAKNRRKAFIFKLCAAAACILMITGIVFLTLPGDSIRIFVSGEALSDEAIQINVPSPMTGLWREVTPTPITVPLEIRSSGNIKIGTDDGMVEVYSSNTLLYEGDRFEGKGPVTVNWTVNALTGEETFSLFINETTEILLSYEKDAGWVIIKK